jgi:thiosulfate/3-mercaptopyruvate sulfurtransferase
VFDCRFDLVDPGFGRQAYERRTCRGPSSSIWTTDLSGAKTGRNGRHPLPDPARLAARLAACGVGNHSQVVAYDDAGGMFAARLWWLLRWLGHHRVAVLDGGLQAWMAAGQALDDGLPRRAPPPTRWRCARIGSTHTTCANTSASPTWC